MDGADDGDRLEGREKAEPRAAVHSLGAPVFHMQLESLRKQLGPDAFERGLARLSPADVRRVRSAPALGWVPFDLVETLVGAMADEAGEPREVFQLDLVRQTTTTALSGIWRILARFTTRRALLRRAGTYWRKTWSHGDFEWSSEREGVMVWRVINLVDASDYMLRGVAFSIRALLEHTGKRVLEVTWTRTRSGAEYQIRWEA